MNSVVSLIERFLMKVDSKADALIQEAVERGYFTEADMKRHGFSIFARKMITFALRRSVDWDHWYAAGDTELFMKYEDIPAVWKQYRALETRYAPKGHRP